MFAGRAMKLAQMSLWGERRKVHLALSVWCNLLDYNHFPLDPYTFSLKARP